MRTLVAVSRRELYELVWSEPATKVAERFGVSGTGLRKICDRHDIPVPPRGHWAKVAANKRVTRPRLPRLKDSDEKVYMRRSGGSGNGQAVSDGHASKRAEPVRAQREFEEHAENKIIVEQEKPRRGAWARELNTGMREGARRYDGGVDYRGMRTVGLENGALSLLVSDASRSRALAIVDALESALRKGKFLKGARGEEARLEVEGIALHLRLSERANRVPRQKKRDQERASIWDSWRSNGFTPSGVLQLRIIYGEVSYPSVERRVVEDGQSPLEGLLNHVMTLLVEVAVKANLKEARLAEESRKRQLEWERAEAERRQREAEAARARHLIELSERWAQAEKLRTFIAAVERSGAAPLSVAGGQSFDEWLAWASAHADAIDPLRRSQ